MQFLPSEEYRKTCKNFPRDVSFYQEVARRTLLDSRDHQQVQKALQKVELEMGMDSFIKEPALEASRIVDMALMSTIWDDVDNKNWKVVISFLNQADASHLSLNLLLQDDRFMEKFCWIGSLEGYASQTLKYCIRAAETDTNEYDSYFADYKDYARALAGEPSLTSDFDVLGYICKNGSLDGYADRVVTYCDRAIELWPEDSDLHDYRGLARTMTGNLSGAIEDFNFYIEHAVDFGYSETMIQERKVWILNLQRGINPFTSEVINQLKGQ